MIRFAELLRPYLDPASGAGEDAAGLPERLEACSRYVALVAQQLEAREQNDRERLQRLEQERRVLEEQLQPVLRAAAEAAGELGEAEGGEDDGTGGLAFHRELARLLGAGLEELAALRQAAGDEPPDPARVRRWDLIETGALRAARDLGGARVRRPGRYPGPEPGDTTLDVRF